MSTRDQFIVPKRYNTLAISLMAVGLLAIGALWFSYGAKGGHDGARFWASLLQNSVFFLLVVNASSVLPHLPGVDGRWLFVVCRRRSQRWCR
jgi:hypothetical protein